MDILNQLRQYQYSDWNEADRNLSEIKPHCFVPTAQDVIERTAQKFLDELDISFPPELLSFWRVVGSGDFYLVPPDKYIEHHEVLDPESILGIYFEEDDPDGLYNTVRAEAWENLKNDKLLVFCVDSEYSTLDLSLEPDDSGKSAVYSLGTKIADSFEEYIQRILEDPDYFIDEDEDDITAITTNISNTKKPDIFEFKLTDTVVSASLLQVLRKHFPDVRIVDLKKKIESNDVFFSHNADAYYEKITIDKIIAGLNRDGIQTELYEDDEHKIYYLTSEDI